MGTGEQKEMRAAYVETVTALAEKNKDIVVLEADLMSCTNTGGFKKAHGNQFVNAGIAEANMIGLAAGLSVAGKIPFASTFGCFASRRVHDQFFISANYARLNVKLIGMDPGVTAAMNGGTHMPFEDIALMRVIPGLTIVEPSDYYSCAALVREAAEHYGCVYIRFPRKPVPVLYSETESFKFGQAKLLKAGKDLCFITLGGLEAGEALKAREILAAGGIDAGVLDLLSVKPLDEEAILAQAAAVKAIVTAENAQLAGGVGGAVAELLMEKGCAVKFGRIGIKDEFGEVGSQDYLAKRFGLTADKLVEKARELLG
ncbi:MAG: transketolase family protein [Spirochaetaceae bacterium]|jgi:transketolase|nr:transketolase family protein [Spirochaetaceae bacterium]